MWFEQLHGKSCIASLSFGPNALVKKEVRTVTFVSGVSSEAGAFEAAILVFTLAKPPTWVRRVAL